MPKSTTRARKRKSNNSAIDRGSLVVDAVDVVTAFMGSVRQELHTPRVLNKPAFLFGDKAFAWGEYSDLDEPRPSRSRLTLLSFDALRGKPMSEIAQLLLRDEAATIKRLIYVAEAFRAEDDSGDQPGMPDAVDFHVEQFAFFFLSLARGKAS